MTNLKHKLLFASLLATGAAHGGAGDIVKLVDYLTAPTTQTTAFRTGATHTLCFVPDGASCEKLIINQIHQTKQLLLIQAYSFTNPKIAEAVKQAKLRGVDVRVIVDKSQVSEKYTAATFLKNAGIPVWVDSQVAISHNKVMIFDQTAVFTGSFNFSKSAEERNAENGIVIAGDGTVVSAYTGNWQKRLQVSVPY